jgi:actin-related protein
MYPSSVKYFTKLFFSGGNTDLQGFVHRFSSDLRELMPEHSMIINVCPYRTGNHSWNTVMGANAVRIAAPYGQYF